MNEVNVGNCGDCPFVQKESLDLKALQVVGEHLTSLAKTNNIDERAVEAFEQFAAQGIELPPNDDGDEITNSDELAVQLRKSTADILNRLDRKASETKDLIQHSTFACEGPLKMRAQKAGRIITATICNTPLAPSGETLESTLLNRTFPA